MKKKRISKRKKPINVYTFIVIFTFIAMMSGLAYTTYTSSKPAEADMKYTEFMEKVDKGEVEKVSLVEGRDTMQVYLNNGMQYSVINPKSENYKEKLLERGVSLNVSKQTFTDALSAVLYTLPTLILTFVLVLYILKTMNSTSNTLFKILKDEEVTTFDEVAGMDEIRDEVQFAVDMLKNHNELAMVGARPTKGILLEGQPGTGKTLIARAIAGEAKVPLISTSGSDFVEMFVGLGAARVRTLFSIAEANAPCVVFIDEIDAVGKRRSANVGNTEGNQTLNALLQKMDGLGDNKGILVIAATNLASELDPALVRPGRFDKKITVTAPRTKQSRDAIIEVHIRDKKLEPDIDKDKMSRLMFGLTGAEIESVLNEAVIISVRENRHGVISLNDIDRAVMKLLASGVAVRTHTEKDTKIAAVHEAGHAIMNKLVGRKVSKISIQAYSSGIGGMTITDADCKNNHFETESSLRDELKIFLAGMVAEEIIFGEHSIGCSNDLMMATRVCSGMIGDYGMGDNFLISMNSVSTNERNFFIDRVNEELLRQRDITYEMLSKHREEIESLSERLIDEETILDY